MGVLQYVQDYDEKYPPAYRSGENTAWHIIIQPYLKSTQIYQCPSDSQTAVAAGGYWGAVATADRYHVSYGMNENLLALGSSNGNGLSESAVASTSKTVLITDTGATPASGAAPTTWSTTVKLSPWMIDDAAAPRGGGIDYSPNVISNTNSGNDALFSGPSPRHLETCNVLWMDGHVKSQRVESFYSTTAGSPCFNPSKGCP